MFWALPEGSGPLIPPPLEPAAWFAAAAYDVSKAVKVAVVSLHRGTDPRGALRDLQPEQDSHDDEDEPQDQPAQRYPHMDIRQGGHDHPSPVRYFPQRIKRILEAGYWPLGANTV
jgi:hypothetical protein